MHQASAQGTHILWSVRVFLSPAVYLLLKFLVVVKLLIVAAKVDT
jgi:hypothetical protein